MLMPGPPAPLPPGRAQAEGARRRGRARRRALRLRQPPEPRHDPHERERALVARRPRPLGDPLPARRGAERGGRARDATSCSPGVEDVVFCYLRFPSGKIAHMHLSWLDPHKMRKMTVVGREKMVVFDDMELERKVTVYEKAPWEPRADLRRVADAHGRHLQPEDRERRAAAARAASTSCASSRRRRRPPRGRADGLAVVRALDRLHDVARRSPA